MNDTLIKVWAFVTGVFMVLVVIMAIRSQSPMKAVLLAVGVILSAAWPVLLPAGFVWGVVAGIRQNREDTRKAKEAEIIRAAIFSQYPQFHDGD